MKIRSILFTTVLAFILLCCPAVLADTDVQIVGVLGDAGIAQPVQLKQWGDSAACFAETDGVKHLIVLEKQDGS